AEVICCRIASSVVLVKTSAFTEALTYITQLCASGIPVQVVSLSMGGAPSASWASAVNAAYDAGITSVSVARSNFHGFHMQNVICPARFAKVIASCEVTYNMKPYFTLKPGEMQSCFEPKRHM